MADYSKAFFRTLSTWMVRAHKNEIFGSLYLEIHSLNSTLDTISVVQITNESGASFYLTIHTLSF